jgi:hypothetical protein
MRYTVPQVRVLADAQARALAKALAAMPPTRQESPADDRAVYSYNRLRMTAVDAKPSLEAHLPAAFVTGAADGKAQPTPTLLEVRNRCDQIRTVLNIALLGPGLAPPAKGKKGGRK